ncbi:MAG TPA: hypothetical protein VFI22_06265 [Thermomicrobiales bacterium]|nr:hypothetical protein [Thermomicrobiales bacterium]
MREPRFDDLVQRFSRDVGSRRRALALAAALLGAATAAPIRVEAASRKKKRCRKRGGHFLRKGECRCASTGAAQFCHGETNCYCWETVAGKGFCGLLGEFSGCEADADCPAGQTCVVERGTTACDESCLIVADCGGGNCGCISGECLPTLCAAPCPA